MKFFKKVFNALFISGILTVAAPALSMGAMSDYCSTPPFLSNTVPPNVLIVLDNSGSMNWAAYAGAYDPSQFVVLSNGTTGYYGLFDATKYYQYTNNGRWEEVPGKDTSQSIPASGPSGAVSTTYPIASGSLMNWASMHRVDVAKKLLIGGKASPRSPGPGITVKLYGEGDSFSNSYDNSGNPNLILPFSGDYDYSMNSSAQLNLIPPSVSSPTILPSNQVFGDDVESTTAGWTATGLWHREDGTGLCTQAHAGSGSWYYGRYVSTDTPTCNFMTVTSWAVPLTFVASGSKITRSSGSFVTDGFTAGMTITTTSTDNPGPFTIISVAADTINVSEAVVDKSVTATITSSTASTNSGALTSKTIALPLGTPTLSFWYYYQTQSSGTASDQRWVQISTDGGTSWANLTQLSGDSMSAWIQKTIDLSAYAGTSVKLRFYFNTVDSIANNYRGWYIDDISITAGCTISTTAAWTKGGTGAPTSECDAVDDAASDGNTTYIQNSSTQDPIILNYNYTGAATAIIQKVDVIVTAEKAGTSTSSTRNIKGALRIGGTNYFVGPSALTTSYKDFTFTWSTNPATGAAWTWSDIKSAGIGSIQGFGMSPSTLPTATNYPRVTRMRLYITVALPSGGPYNIIVDQGGVKATGIIDGLSDSARFGLMYYANSSNGGKIDTYVDFGATTSMITSISNMSPSTWTPLGETLYEAARYFENIAPYYSNSPADYQTGNNYDPYYYQYSKLGAGGTDKFVPCAKSFIMFLTDGESTQDTTMSAGIKGFSWGKGVNPDGSSTGSALGNLRLGGTPNGQTYSSSGTDYMIDAAYYARTTDNRSASLGRTSLTGNQNIILYPVFLFGKGSTLLKDASIYGGFNDLNGDGKPGPDVREYLRDSNGDGSVTSADDPLTYFEGDDGYALEASITDTITSIMKRAASGTAVSVLTTSSRGVGSMVQAYFLPTKQEGLREVSWTGYLQNLWIDPKDNLREDTVNDYKFKLADDYVVKLYYDTANSATKAATFTTDADGNGGGLASCTYMSKKDFADVTYLWEVGKKLALRTAQGGKSPSERNLFTSSKVLKTSGTTSITTTTNTFTTGVCGSLGSSVSCFTNTGITGTDTPGAANCTGLTGETLTKCNALNSDATFTPGKIVSYVRGECIETDVTGDTACGATADALFRDRRLTVTGGDTNGNVWKLGDIISSTPKVLANTPLNTYHIDYGDSTYYDYITSNGYKQRSAMAFAGANDGMLHAFRVGYLKDKDDANGSLASGVKALFRNFFSSSPDTTNDRLGEEVWAYIPFNAFPYLKYLADPQYCHVYFNDLSVRVVDASIGGSTALDGNPGGTLPTDTRTQANWKTILIGGMRFGGACSGGIAPTAPPAGASATVGFSAYYAIDVTDPENPVPLWEFSDNDMGYATTFPSIIRTNAGGVNSTNGNWYVVLGSGSQQLPNSLRTVDRTGNGYIYVLDLKTGALVKKIDMGSSRPGIMGDILAIDADKDYQSEKIYFGDSRKSNAACTASSGTTWCGDLFMIDIPRLFLTSGVYVAWGVNSYASSGGVGFGDTIFTGPYPFLASPDVAKDTSGNIWAYIGSGKYYSDLDESDTSQQIFMGITDRSASPYSSSSIAAIGSLDNRTSTTTTGNVTGTSQVCAYNSTTDNFEFQTVVISTNQTSAATSAANIGWYINLDTSERVITRPLAVGGLVDFLTYKPSLDVCSGGGDSYLYAVGYTTGVAPANVAILSSQATSGTSGEVTVNKRVLLGPGAPPTGEAIIIPPPKEGQEALKKKIQVATGVVVEAENDPVTSVISKIIHWLKK